MVEEAQGPGRKGEFMNSAQRGALERRNYYSDPRTIAAMQTAAYKVVDSGPRRVIIELDELLLDSLIDDELLPDGHNGVLEMQTETEVCGMCHGSAKVIDPKYDAGGLTREDIEEDPEWFYDSYMGGDCDITCPSCGGMRVVFMPKFTDEKLGEAIARWVHESEEDARTRARELAMGY